MKKLKNILLVDDDIATNFINKKIINDSHCAEHVDAVTSGKAALDYLVSKTENLDQPELIFLDINMPAMNGWEFLEEYKKLKDSQKAKIIIVMLTTSLNPDDYDKAKEIPEIDDFKNKPLNNQAIEDIMTKYFPES
ncbi:Response regulator receiver domain-containing protein [Pustulibacterium marinum]|uniref:Response regulator receiver domain-containing protein n=1 Tax=Pustulibacterium marinum TaxID=1224947 RepID=A0A1I7GCW3_9FLAO|nr:response regulator [Pustulibacterium marinum]SFU46297.1 Response regulator receiver domain-containing protein [Pustulibacterium marinum]